MRQSTVRLGLFILAISTLTGGPAFAEDARARCAKTGDDDRVKVIPPALVAGAARLYDEDPRQAARHRQLYAYRCMDGAVWVCNHGANIPCAKGDTSTSLPGLASYCRENPETDFVPMYVTGHSTIHSFACAGGKPRVTDSQKTDARGFVTDHWKRLD